MRISTLTTVCLVATLFFLGFASAWRQPDVPRCPEADRPKGCIPRLDFDTFCNGKDVPPGFIIKDKDSQIYRDFGVKFDVGRRAGDAKFDPKKNVLMTFDTSNPGKNRDFGAPNTGCPGCKDKRRCPGFCDGQKPGQDPKRVPDCGGASNCEKLGNVLIISADADSKNPRPSDKGGVINVTFDKPVKLDSIRFLDVDEKKGDNGFVKVFQDRGRKSDKIKIPKSGDNGVSKIKLDKFKDVVKLEIEIVGDVALVDITPSDKDLCPEPDVPDRDQKCICKCKCRRDGVQPDPDDKKHRSFFF